MTDLITSWRKAWGTKFPFIIIQLPNYMAVQPNPSESGWAELREAQLQTSQTVPLTGLVTTIDLGEANNIHPKDKTDVGHRVALLGLNLAYWKKGIATGPQFKALKAKGGKLILAFDSVGKGLITKDGGPVTGFAVAGDDDVYHWASAKIIGSNTLEVSCSDVAKPLGVRYAWADNPVCDLINKEGLPATPFQFSFPRKPSANKNPADDIPPPP
jgi:sialate O-acetylesterase